MVLSSLSMVIATVAIASQLVSCAPADDLMVEAVLTHNNYRAKHHVGSLIWNHDLANHALQVSQSCIWGYNNMEGAGQNIAYGYPSMKAAVDGWYVDVSSYNYDTGSFINNGGAGQFTQVVWKGTIEIGCGATYCEDLESVYYVCNYSPAGNVANEFTANVFRP